MSDELPEVPKDKKGEQLTKHKPPEALPKSEKEIFEGRISELEKENGDLRAENKSLREKREEPPTPKPAKKKSLLDDWLP